MSNTETMKEVYLLAQEHCGLKVGDYVKLTRFFDEDECGLIGNKFMKYDNIGPLLGDIGRILNISQYGIQVDFYRKRCIWLCPYFVLEKAEGPAHKFKPFDKVLVRDNSCDEWRIDFFSHINKDRNDLQFCCLNEDWAICIPFEGNERLVGTSYEPESK